MFDKIPSADPPAGDDERPIQPERRSIIDVPVSIVDYAHAVDHVMWSARRREPLLVTALAVHGVVEARSKADVLRAISAFDLVTPDGQPVRMALNLLHGASLSDRVYGPALMLRICRAAAEAGLPIYLYGSTADVISSLASRLVDNVPGLLVAGAEPSIFRPLDAEESADLGARIRASGAALVFIGLGCPRQERFAFDHRDVIGLPQICVGAAFDFHAGSKRQAPSWMQDHALEWLFRLSQEPRRLLRRYAVTNTVFLIALVRQWAGRASGSGV
ncbi:WecB/TagA/CpsF family glycosyltransferase [Tranquillimonas alkanivorans]|uniref:Polymer biosynthesis protein, WecB/TagA/CpsF family n=1 Tax=Tranquillimonas alkanivorans TaxID=441119 RepID=A0A1I5VQK5_9RHOB|nr:WecB/TagA/CpsF family glycosyltransferase [Tranquillimonas alkanivorans]SFQ09732.1 polymer biosynthesis protein, WecB/TagA/CpsF family [Tranquillimonas alkanivorans]